MNKYESVVLDRKGARQIAFSIIDAIEDFCALHAEEFKTYCEALEAEEQAERGGATSTEPGEKNHAVKTKNQKGGKKSENSQK